MEREGTRSRIGKEKQKLEFIFVSTYFVEKLEKLR